MSNSESNANRCAQALVSSAPEAIIPLLPCAPAAGLVGAEKDEHAAPAPSAAIDAEASVATTEERGEFKRYWGILLTALSAAQFSANGAVVKLLNYRSFNLGAWRFSIILLISLPVAYAGTRERRQEAEAGVKKKLDPDASTGKLLKWKIIFYFIILSIIRANHILLTFFALPLLSVGDVMVISSTAPVFVTIFAFIFLREKSGIFPYLMAAIIIVGVGIIARPPILTGASTYDIDTITGTALTFGSMLCVSGSFVLIRHLRKVHHSVIMSGIAAAGALQSIVVGYFMDALSIPGSAFELWLIALSTLLALGSGTCATLALKYEQAGTVALFQTTGVVFAFLWQYLLLGVVPDWISVLGAVIVVSSVLLSIWRKIISNLPEENKYKKTFKLILI